ncbi:MAG: DUF4347 domain-containing protein, partial [Gammaproteobacteria bacterium]|nr:DUF4347 domain-containing protein [Gammaproteobacteria bacterium]
MSQKKFPPRRKSPIIEALEPRILYSADAFSAALDANSANDPFADTLEQVRLEYDRTVAEAQKAAALHKQLDSHLPEDAETSIAARDSADEASETLLSVGNEESAVELVIIDTGTPDYEQLRDDLLGQMDDGRQIDFVLLDPAQDGIAQITSILHDYQNLNAVHLISHGSDGSLALGNSTLDADTLAENSGAIGSWANAFRQNGDFLIYGCNLAESEQGRSLVDQLFALTSLDFAASDDLTGHRSLGGDWDLEYRTGQIETAIAPSAHSQASWQNTLASFTVNTFADTVDANLGDGLALDAGGNTSLRAAIMEANALAGADSISLGSGTYTLTRAGTLEDLGSTGDLDITGDLTITGTGFNSTFIDGNNLDRVFDLLSGTSTLSGMTITGGDTTVAGGDGAGIQVNQTATLNLSDSSITNSDANKGGGLSVRGIATLTDVTIDNNSAGSKGGGILVQGGNLSLNNSTISNNTSSGQGGGMLITNNATVVTATNSTISGNTASTEGGAIRMSGNTATLGLQNVTITDNQAADGGGLFIASGDASLRNAIIAVNSATSNTDISGSVTSQGNNLIGNSTGTTGWLGSDILDVTPTLGALDFNGGSTKTHALMSGSRGINEGSATGAPALDQRGESRAGATDIGAYEYNPSAPNNIAVTTTSDDNDAGLVDGNASHTIDYLLANKGADGEVSLREAIIASNNTSNIGSADIIRFNILGAGSFEIMPQSDLDHITDTVFIDATTQFGYTGTPIIELDGTNSSFFNDGLTFDTGSAGSTVKGLAFTSWINAIELNSDNNTVVANYIGLDLNGAKEKNFSDGIRVNSVGNTIGGDSAADRNIISGNDSDGIELTSSASNNIIIGNYIGTNVSGTAAIANAGKGININGSGNNIIGGDRTAGEGNLISGNAGQGIHLNGAGADNNTIKGNYIGTDADGTAPIANGSYGIELNNAAGNIIGGPLAGEGNVISGNVGTGISFWNTLSINNIVQGNY